MVIRGYSFVVILALAVILFIMNSFPMMRPGFDMWWHMAMTEAPQQANPQAFPTSRILWHYFWNHLLAVLQLRDIFDRALFVHRAQFLMSTTLLAASAYLVLRSVLHRIRIPTSEVLLAALLSAVIWFLMNGTASTAHDGGEGAYVVQSWIMWYSLNYQISLPFYFAATASLLYSLSAAITLRERVVSFVCSIVFILICSLLHAAETVYFLICLVIFTLLYLRGNHALQAGLGVIILCAATVWVALRQSYAVPELLTLAVQGDVSTLTERIANSGTLMTEGGLNRIATGWSFLHSISLASIAASAIFGAWRYPQKLLAINLDQRAVGFILFTCLMPLALWTQYSAGFLAMLLPLHIAWRFTFASFVYVGLPLLGLVLAQFLRPSQWFGRHAAIVLVVLIGLTTSVWYSKLSGSADPVYPYARSLKRSLDPESNYFGLTNAQRKELGALAQALGERSNQSPVCTDMFTAYYLFFVERYRSVEVPGNLAYLPGYVASAKLCDFAPSDLSLSRNKSQ
jgi:hypothetical protein